MISQSLVQLLLRLSTLLIVARFVKSYECGISNSRNSRIVGGREAEFREFPWQISLKRNRGHICGGTLVHPKWVVTAAHCMGGTVFEDFTVEAGLHHLYLDNYHKQTRKIQRVIRHPQFNREQFRNDIALIEVDEPFRIHESDGFVNTACLPKNNLKISNGTVTVSGWGKVKEGFGNFYDLLQAMRVPVISDSKCISLYTSLWSLLSTERIQPDKMFCAGLENGGKDACQGDSGGPAVQNVGGKMHLVGVVSFGYGCARAGNPGVYTEVPYYVPWIQSVIQSYRRRN